MVTNNTTIGGEEKAKRILMTDSFSYYFYFHYSFIVFFITITAIFENSQQNGCTCLLRGNADVFYWKTAKDCAQEIRLFTAYVKVGKKIFRFSRRKICTLIQTQSRVFVYFNEFLWRRKAKKNEFPAHTVSLKAYWKKLDLKIQIVNFIDLNEVEDDHSFFFFQEIIHLSFMSVFAYSWQDFYIVYIRGLKLKYIRGPHFDEKSARGPHKEAEMSPRATKGRKSAFIPH